MVVNTSHVVLISVACVLAFSLTSYAEARGGSVPPSLWIVDLSGNAVDTISAGQQVQIASNLANPQDRAQAFAYFVQVQDSDGAVVALTGLSGALEAGQEIRPSVSWMPTEAGAYTVTSFVWESVDNPTPLLYPLETYIVVS